MVVALGFQIRTRKMVNKGGDESTCSSRDEIRTCRIESCYEWKIVEKGGCKLNDINAKCGVGKEERVIECRAWDGVRMNENYLLIYSHLPYISVPSQCIYILFWTTKAKTHSGV